MPFKSKAQRTFMYANHPDIAKRWEDKYGSGGKTLLLTSRRRRRR